MADPLRAGPDGRIDPAAFAARMREKIAASALNGQAPDWAKPFGVATGSPDEWARLFTMVQQQESGHRTAPVNPDGTLQRFPTTIPTERSFGPGQFNVGEYGLKTWGDVNDPDKVADAYIRVAEAGKVPAYFGSIQRPNETLRHAGWYDKTVAPRVAGMGSSFDLEGAALSGAPQTPASDSKRPAGGKTQIAAPYEAPTTGGQPAANVGLLPESMREELAKYITSDQGQSKSQPWADDGSEVAPQIRYAQPQRMALARAALRRGRA